MNKALTLFHLTDNEKGGAVTSRRFNPIAAHWASEPCLLPSGPRLFIQIRGFPVLFRKTSQTYSRICGNVSLLNYTFFKWSSKWDPLCVSETRALNGPRVLSPETRLSVAFPRPLPVFSSGSCAASAHIAHLSKPHSWSSRHLSDCCDPFLPHTHRSLLPGQLHAIFRKILRHF